MSVSEERDPGKADHSGNGRSTRENEAIKMPAKKKGAGRPADVGRALRSVYDDTLREDIPADLRDLLGRLG